MHKRLALTATLGAFMSIFSTPLYAHGTCELPSDIDDDERRVIKSDARLGPNCRFTPDKNLAFQK